MVSWPNLEAFVQSNMKTMQTKMVNYVDIDTKAKKLKCDKLQYSWYIIAFSYELEKETLYGGQYFLTDEAENLYFISFSSDDEKDIDAFIKSTKTIKCND